MKSKNQAYVYQLGIDGIYGRKLEKNGGENCEQPWFILIDKNTTQPLVEKTIDGCDNEKIYLDYTI